MSSESKRVGIGLGSNVGDRLRFLQLARDQIQISRESNGPFLQSSVYETAPVGCAAASENFYNATLEVTSTAAPEEMLKFLQAIERALGRPADHPRNAPRTIDLDLLYFGDSVIEQPGMRLPHPRMAEREFVLRPLTEIAPQLRLPKQRATVIELLAALPKNGGVRRVHEKW